MNRFIWICKIPVRQHCYYRVEKQKDNSGHVGGRDDGQLLDLVLAPPLTPANVSLKKTKKSLPTRGGGPHNFFPFQILFLRVKKPHVIFRNPRITLSGRKVTGGERREKEKKAPSIVATMVRLQCPRAVQETRSVPLKLFKQNVFEDLAGSW